MPRSEQAAVAVMLAEDEGPPEMFAAHEMAARVALVSGDKEAAPARRGSARSRPLDARTAVRAGTAALRRRAVREGGGQLRAGGDGADGAPSITGRPAPVLWESRSRVSIGYDEAESQFREELRDFPRSIQAYTSLAMLYRASNRDAAVEDVLNELVASTPTPEGYGVAARLWTILGDPSRAEALRSDARTRFRGDPSLALLGRGGR